MCPKREVFCAIYANIYIGQSGSLYPATQKLERCPDRNHFKRTIYAIFYANNNFATGKEN